MEKVSLNINPSIWEKETRQDVVKISYLNARSLVNKFENIKKDSSLHQSDIMILVETWISIDQEPTDKYQLHGFYSHWNNSGRGKGLAVFSKQGQEIYFDDNEENINITKIKGTD